MSTATVKTGYVSWTAKMLEKRVFFFYFFVWFVSLFFCVGLGFIRMYVLPSLSWLTFVILWFPMMLISVVGVSKVIVVWSWCCFVFIIFFVLLFQYKKGVIVLFFVVPF